MFTDPQPETEAEVDFIREDAIHALAGVNAKFGLTAGDIMFDDLSLYPRYNAIIFLNPDALADARAIDRRRGN